MLPEEITIRREEFLCLCTQLFVDGLEFAVPGSHMEVEGVKGIHGELKNLIDMDYINRAIINISSEIE